MNEESQDWFRELESAAQEFGQCMQKTVDAIAETADFMMQVPIIIAEHVEDAIATEVDQFLDEVVEWFQPPVHVSVRFDVGWNHDIVEPWVDTVEPGQGQQTACVGCRHYHGRVYNGNLLVCGMHPYGWEGDKCPDWDSESWSSESWDSESWGSESM